MRYFLDKIGAKTMRMQGHPGGGHVAIAREVLPRHGIAPADDGDCYTQMFALKYARVVEHPDCVLEVEFKGRLTTGQRNFVEGMKNQGWSIRLLRRN